MEIEPVLHNADFSAFINRSDEFQESSILWFSINKLNEPSIGNFDGGMATTDRNITKNDIICI